MGKEKKKKRKEEESERRKTNSHTKLVKMTHVVRVRWHATLARLSAIDLGKKGWYNDRFIYRMTLQRMSPIDP